MDEQQKAAVLEECGLVPLTILLTKAEHERLTKGWALTEDGLRWQVVRRLLGLSDRPVKYAKYLRAVYGSDRTRRD